MGELLGIPGSAGAYEGNCERVVQEITRVVRSGVDGRGGDSFVGIRKRAPGHIWRFVHLYQPPCGVI